MIRNSQNNLEAMLFRYQSLEGDLKLQQGSAITQYMRNVREDLVKQQISQLKDRQLLRLLLSFGAKGNLTQFINAKLERG